MTKLGLGLYRHMLTPENFRFARQAGATHIVPHWVDYFTRQGNVAYVHLRNVKGKAPRYTKSSLTRETPTSCARCGSTNVTTMTACSSPIPRRTWSVRHHGMPGWHSPWVHQGCYDRNLRQS